LTLVDEPSETRMPLRSLIDASMSSGQGSEKANRPYERHRSTSAHSFFSIPLGHVHPSLLDDSEKTPIHDKSLLQDSTIRGFMEGSFAQTEAFVPPNPVQASGTQSNKKYIDNTGNNGGIISHETVEITQLVTNTPESSTKSTVNTTTDAETADDCTPAKKEHVRAASASKHSSVLSMMVNFIKAFTTAALTATGHLEPLLQPGCTRLRWQCVSEPRMMIS
jgi:hypothetical protein